MEMPVGQRAFHDADCVYFHAASSYMGQAIRLPQPWCYALPFCRAAPWHTDSKPVLVLAGAIPAAFALTTATDYLIVIVHNNFSSMFKNVGGFGGVLSVPVPVPVSLPGALGSPLPLLSVPYRHIDALRHFQAENSSLRKCKQDYTPIMRLAPVLQCR
jgi:hypothetical protein